MLLRYTVLLGVGLIGLLAILLIATFFLSQGSGCSPGSFACKSGDVCVPQRDMCNGHADCPEADDESANTCGDFHGSTFLMNRMKEATFNLSIHICAQRGIPLGCYCRKHSWIYCKDLNLTSVPAHIQGNVSRLILANNSISELADDSFSNYQLTLIHLEGNGIQRLARRIFDGQRNLVTLLLMNNKIENIEGSIFRDLSSLSMLYLQKNRISHLDPDTFSSMVSLRYLDLSWNNLTLSDSIFPFVPNLKELILDGNRIKVLQGDEFTNLTSIEFLGLSSNDIQQINPDTFQPLYNLTELDVSRNRLSQLEVNVFKLNRLKKLFLGHNPLETIPGGIFKDLPSLRSLDLEEIEIKDIKTEMFDSLKDLDFIYFKKYYYCTFTPYVPKCAPKTDGLSTFEDLLGKPILRTTVWIVAFITWVGNIYVFFGRLASRDENRTLSWIVRSLADFLMGVYLLVIGVQDTLLRGIYHKESHKWMESWTCSIAGALAMLSSEVSIFILVFMSIERFLLIAVPFSGRKTLNTRAAARVLVCIWAVGLALAFLPMVLYRSSTRFYGSNGMCFPLHLDDPFFPGWQISAFVFLFINLLGLLVLAILYSGMFISVWTTRHATTLKSGDFEFAIRFFFIVLTNTVCWLPIVILKILAFYRIYISASAYAWIAVVVVPVNSAFNPLLYTLTTPKYWETIKNFCLTKTRSTPLTSVDNCSNASHRRTRLSTLDTNDSMGSANGRPSSFSRSSLEDSTKTDLISITKSSYINRKQRNGRDVTPPDARFYDLQPNQYHAYDDVCM